MRIFFLLLVSLAASAQQYRTNITVDNIATNGSFTWTCTKDGVVVMGPSTWAGPTGSYRAAGEYLEEKRQVCIRANQYGSTFTYAAETNAPPVQHGKSSHDGTVLNDADLTNINAAIAGKVATSDARLSDARAPLAHDASLVTTGVFNAARIPAIAESGVTNLVNDLAAKVATNDGRLTDARTPTAHATSHKVGGIDTILVSELGGTLGISNGGTGQTGAAAAFDALAPTTTRGDLIVRGASGNSRLAIGNNRLVPMSNGTDIVNGSASTWVTLGTTTAPACSAGGGTNTFVGLASSNTTENSVIRIVAGRAGVIDSLNFKLNGNVPASETVTITVMINAAANATATCSIAAGASACGVSFSPGVAVAVNDLITARVNCAGGTTALTAPIQGTIGIR